MRGKASQMLRVSGLLALVLLAACEKKPEGQVVAVVNGDEITMQELNAELGNAEQPEGAALDELRNAALDNLVNRRLLSGVAREEGVDASPEFVMRRRQLEEALLVQMLAQKTARDIKQPTTAELDKFVADNPQMFANRMILAVDQVRFQTPERRDYIAALEPAKSMADVVGTLNRLGIRFERGNVQVDTAAMPADMYRQVMAVGSSEPFVMPGPAMVSVSQIVSTQPAPVPQAQVRTAATNMLQQLNVAKQLDERIKAAKAEAGIAYQSGFAAPKAPATDAASAAARPPATSDSPAPPSAQ
ncbi:SurA N-terminal domain-containing protein [Leptolyngbya sp. 15MV]|nr:SurA N-terminal domain-containing protein [Leptolyngbya sp. 15MV]